MFVIIEFLLPIVFFKAFDLVGSEFTMNPNRFALKG